MDDSYRLPPADHQRIYNEEIEPAFFAQTQPVAQPTLVVIAGQKTCLVEKITCMLRSNRSESTTKDGGGSSIS
jgi:hypothetical protein